jgi:hypothetical protein
VTSSANRPCSQARGRSQAQRCGRSTSSTSRSRGCSESSFSTSRSSRRAASPPAAGLAAYGAACMLGVPAYRFPKATSCVSQLEAHSTRRGAVVDRRELPHAASFDLRNEASRSLCHGGAGDLRYRLHAGLPSTALALNSRRRWDARPRESQTDQRQLSGGHARRLRALTPAAHLLAWKLETK